jgi:hypothetical protein
MPALVASRFIASVGFFAAAGFSGIIAHAKPCASHKKKVAVRSKFSLMRRLFVGASKPNGSGDFPEFA